MAISPITNGESGSDVRAKINAAIAIANNSLVTDFAADAGSTDAYVATLNPAPAALVTGAHYRFKANTANTGAATINFNGLGAKTIVKAAGGITTALADNDIRAGQWVDVVYDGTNMQMQSTLGNAASGGGIGGSVGATDNAVPRADGTGAATLQGSLVIIDDSGFILTPGVGGSTTTPQFGFSTGGGLWSASGGQIALAMPSNQYVATNGSAWYCYPAAQSLGVDGIPWSQIFLEQTGIKLGNGTNGPAITASGTSPNENLNLNPSPAGTGVVTLGSPLRLKGYTVGTLPAGTLGDTAFVTDALEPVSLANVANGGAVVVKVFYNGSNWIVQ